jgi:hypothetical protein
MIYYHKIIPVSFARQDSPEFKKSNFNKKAFYFVGFHNIYSVSHQDEV